jgi:hypothetical protein
MDASRIEEVKAPQHLKTPSFHLLLGLVPFFLMFGSSFRLELLDVLEVLLHVRQHFFFFDNTGYFLLLFPLDAFHAFSLDFYGGRLLLRRLLQCSLFTGRQPAGPLVRRRLAHQIGPTASH